MLEQKQIRIISLLPSATEILCRLGLGKNLVGISHECDFPENISHLPRLTEPRINPLKRGGEIHQDLIALLKNSLSIYEVNTELIQSLAPDLIVTQDQCDVCAVSLKDLEVALEGLTTLKTKICTLTPHTLDDIVKDILRLGKATNRDSAAEDLVTEFWIRLNSVNAKVGTDRPNRPRVLCLEWLEPLMVGGGWIPEIVTLAGAEPLIVSTPEKFRTLTWQEIYDCSPDIVVIFPCGYSISKTLSEIKSPEILSRLSLLSAFKNGKVFIGDGNQFFNRPGPRITDSCEILAGLFYPEKFPKFFTGHEGLSFTNLKDHVETLLGFPNPEFSK